MVAKVCSSLAGVYSCYGRVAKSAAEMSEYKSFAFQNNLAFPSRTIFTSERTDGTREAGLRILASSHVASSICVVPLVSSVRDLSSVLAVESFVQVSIPGHFRHRGMHHCTIF
ncbi:hypothetical protein XENORESO_006424 [Xenotaenia resolanae]|uniref:Uncharacterized protein n=1 Tax=Xenotaenia resolanae TaxID=208358 RepID=A0ABV0WAF8_9TELE